MQNPVVWISVANAIYLASYTVRDILWLRVLTVAAAAMLIPHYAMQMVPLRMSIGWNVVFILINCYWIVRLIIERRPVHFTSDEARLRELSFPSLTLRVDPSGGGRLTIHYHQRKRPMAGQSLGKWHAPCELLSTHAFISA